MKAGSVKIMLNATCFHPGRPTGIERFTRHIVKELCEIDSSTLVVLSEPIAGASHAIFSSLLACSKLVFGKYEYLVRAIWDQTWLRHIVARQKPDILFFPIQEGMICPPVMQIVTVHDLHYSHFDQLIQECSDEINFLRKRIYQCRMPHILERSVAIVAVSESTKQDIITVFGTNPDKIHVIYNGYDESRFHIACDPQPVLERLGIAEEKYFLFVGSILKHKNIVRLVQAFAKLDTSFRLIIAGACKDAEYLDEIKSVVSGSGLTESRFRYLEYVSDDDLPFLYNGAISFVLPSLHEGFGVPIIEAMACGTPVITSNCSAMPEIAGDAALLVDPTSVESIAAAMQEILDHPQRAEVLRSAGLERAKQFRWSSSAQKLYEVFKMVSES